MWFIVMHEDCPALVVYADVMLTAGYIPFTVHIPAPHYSTALNTYNVWAAQWAKYSCGTWFTSRAGLANFVRMKT